MKRLSFDILGKDWEIRLLKKKKYQKKNGSDSVGITYIDKRRIDIGQGGKDKETFIHELVHAYLAELCVYTADLGDEELEEVFSELMAKRGYELLAKADYLFSKLVKK